MTGPDVPAHPLVETERGGSELGEALIEILVTLVIVGLTVTSILGALLTSTSASTEHRNIATLDGAVTSFAEAARNAIETQLPNGGSGPQFQSCAVISTASSPYRVVGDPNPGAGPTNTGVAVLGLGYGSVSSATISGTSGGFSYSETVPATYAGDHTGAISVLNVPDGNHLLADGITMDTALPAGTYQVAPFGSGTQSAAGFTVTPWVGAMTPRTPGSFGSGSFVTVPVTGFLAGNTLSVQVGSLAATNLSNNMTAANSVAPGAKPGTTTLTFQVPPGLSGIQTVTIADGTNTSTGVSLNLASDTAPANALASISPLASYTFTTSANVWNTTAPNTGWTSSSANGACTGSGYNPNIQQLSFKLSDPQQGSGSYDSVSAVLANFGNFTDPAPPAGLLAVGGTGQVTLTWSAPGYTGGVALSGYNVYRSTSSTGPFSQVNGALLPSTTTTYTDTGLAGGTEYYYEVTAVTTNGEGPGATANATTNSTPGASTALIATGGSHQIGLSWTAPTSSGSSPITGYDVYRSPAGCGSFAQIATGVTTTSYSNTGLGNNATFCYEVTAVSSVGEGPDSNEQSATTFNVPGAPTGLSATGGSHQINLSWTAPVSTGGTSITGYNVYRSPAGCTSFTAIATGVTTTSYANGSLGNNATFCYQVTAVNSAGESQASNQQSATTFNVPGAPTGLSATGGKQQVSLSWTAPASNGGSMITGYNVYRSTAGCGTFTAIATAVPTTSYTDTGLTNNTTYCYQVTAVNSAGESPPSSQQSATTFDVPGAPTSLTATPGNTQVTLSWTPPNSNGGSPITQYNVWRSTTGSTGTYTLIGSTTDGNTTTYVDSGLTNGSAYWYEVVAVNTVGGSTPSNKASATPATVPGAPTLVTVSGNGTGKLKVTWTAPTSNGGSAITDYYVFWRLGTSGSFNEIDTQSSTKLTYTQSGLTSGSTYYYYVEAVNAVNPGPPSSTLSGTAP